MTQPSRLMSLRLGLISTVAAIVLAACSSPLPEATDPAPASPSTETTQAAQENALSTITTQAAQESDASTTALAQSVADGGWNIDVTLSADPNCSNPVTGDPFRIGYAADLVELGAQADRPASQAASLLATLINCSGGLDGRPVEVIVKDISGDAATTRAAVLELLDEDVQAIIGPPFADFGFRVLQVTDGDVPVLFAGSTEPAMADSSLLSYLVAFNDTQGATVAADFALLEGWDTAVTLSFPGPYFGYNSLVFSTVFESRGGTVQGDFEVIPAETQEFSAIVDAIADDPPDVIYSPMFAEQMVELKRELDEAGLDVNILQSDVFDATGGYNLPGNDGIFHVTHGFPASDSRIVQLNNSIRADSGVLSTAPSFAALAGDAIAVIIAAYYAAGQVDDPQLIGAEIATVTNVQGITGTLSYNGTGLPVKTIYVHEVVDGEPTLVFTTG